MGKDQYELSDAPSDSISSLKFAPQTPTRLVVASWDKNVYLFDIQSGGQVLRKYEHRAPVLDICYGDTDDVAFSGGLDWDVRRYLFAITNVNLVLTYISQAQSHNRRSRSPLLAHCRREIYRLLTANKAPHLRLLGLDATCPPSLRTNPPTMQRRTTEQTLLPLPHTHKTRRRNGKSYRLHLLPRKPVRPL